jgi:hypothetical protein
MVRFHLILMLLVLAALCAPAAQLMAESDGALASRSTGKIGISRTIPERLEVSRAPRGLEFSGRPQRNNSSEIGFCLTGNSAGQQYLFSAEYVNRQGQTPNAAAPKLHLAGLPSAAADGQPRLAAFASRQSQKQCDELGMNVRLERRPLAASTDAAALRLAFEPL